MSVLMTEHHISWADLVPKIGFLAWYSLSVYLVEEGLCWPWGDEICFQRLFQSFFSIKKCYKRSSSNGCLSIWQTIIFPRMILCPKLVVGIRSFQHLIVRKDTVSTVMGSNMLSEALPIILIYLTKVINTQAVMDVCPYDRTSHFLGWSCAPNWIFGLIFECLFGRKEAVLVTLRGWDIMSEALLIILIYLRKVGNHPSSNGYLSLWHRTTFSALILCPKLVIWIWNLNTYLVEKTPCWPWGDQICSQRPFQSFLYI